MMPFGCLLGSICSNWAANKFGRKIAFIIADCITIAGASISVVNNPYSIIVGRFLGGISVGLNSVLVPLYINEMSPSKISG